MRVRPAPALTAVAAALLLAGCGGSEPAPAAAPTSSAAAPTTTAAASSSGVGAATSTSAATTPTSTPGTPASPAPSSAATDGGAPAQGQCLDVPPGPSDRYEVPGVGSAVVTLADGRLTLGEIITEGGYASRVDSSSGEEVEVEFRNGAAVQDLEVELDDGIVQGRVCSSTG